MFRLSKFFAVQAFFYLALCAPAYGEPSSFSKCIQSFAKLLNLESKVLDPLLTENLEKLPYVKDALLSHPSNKEFMKLARVDPTRQIIFSAADFDNVLSPRELSVLHDYTRGGYKRLNEALRSENPCGEECATLSEALRKVPVYEGVVFRTVGFGDGKIPAKYISEEQVFVEEAFSSSYRKTDVLAAIAKDGQRAVDAHASRMGKIVIPEVPTLINSGPKRGQILMIIRSRTGRSIEGYSSLGRYESEVLFDAGTTFKKIGVHRTSYGGYILMLDEVVP